MKSTIYIAEFEELVMLAIRKLGDEAYGVTILTELAEAGREVAVGSLYTTLGRMTTKGLVRSRQSLPTGKRGGRSKRLYTILPAGQKALDHTDRVRRKLQ